MDDSILNSIKKMLGIDSAYTHFDDDIKMHINSVFMILNQLGIGPSEGFSINDELALWSDYITDDKQYQAVKSYMYQKVKLLFDPPLNSAVIESMNRMINEFEWRLNVDAELNKSEEEGS